MSAARDHALAACKAGLNPEHKTKITRLVASDAADSDRSIAYDFSEKETALILEAVELALTSEPDA